MWRCREDPVFYRLNKINARLVRILLKKRNPTIITLWYFSMNDWWSGLSLQYTALWAMTNIVCVEAFHTPGDSDLTSWKSFILLRYISAHSHRPWHHFLHGFRGCAKILGHRCSQRYHWWSCLFHNTRPYNMLLCQNTVFFTVCVGKTSR